jgi:class 3 adenylate cyclase/tetratricopeptide (TPR) repeat protein
MSSEPEVEDVSRSRPAFAQEVAEYEKMVQQSASSGQLLTAIEVARDGLARFGGGKTLQQQLALALAQTGALDAARQVLAEVLKQSSNDEETLCLLGRVHKEMWRHASVPAEGQEALRQASKYYSDAFALTESYYPGINLAFTLAALGERAKAEQSAKKVAKQCREYLSRAGVGGGWLGKLMGSEPERPPDFVDAWILATLAEALVHLGETKEAAAYYRFAAERFAGRWRDLASMRRQAREILRCNGQPQEWLDACFQFPTVVMFSGHMMDGAGRATPRFTPEMEPAVREEIRSYLKQVRAGYGYSSAACGGDLIFCECLLEMDAKVNLVLPCPVNAFKRQSVLPGGPEWEKRFHDVLARATTTLIANATGYGTSPADEANALGLIYANRILTGLAVLQAQALDLELKPVALWDGRPAEREGGTGSVVAEWESRQFRPHIVKASFPNGTNGAAVAAPETDAAAAPGPQLPREIRTMVFAEVMNFRKVSEHQLPTFVHEFKNLVARVVAGLPAPPLVAETAGGTVQFVFAGLAEAARLALDLRDQATQIPWAKLGLPADLNIRIALHAGPVFSFADPVTGRHSCLGAHVTRAANIQPSISPGQVYVSQEFAALAGAERLPGVTLEFLGHLPTTRLFEEAPLYRLERRR